MTTIKKKIKVAVIHPSVGYVHAGSETFALEIAKHLNCYCEVKIICQNKLNDMCVALPFINRLDAQNSKNPLIRFFYGLLARKATNPEIAFEYLTSFPAIIFHLLFTHYDVLYPHNHWGGLFVCNLIRKLKKVPILYTEHASTNQISYRRHLKFKPNCYIAHTKSFYDWVRQTFPQIDVKYIPNGINLTKFKSLAKQDIPEVYLKAPIIMTVGEAIEGKRLDLVIEAISRLPQASLLMITAGPEMERLKKQGFQRLGSERFQLLTKVPHDRMPLYYNLCDVFTLPSRIESFGLVYVEAMACNKPVVAPEEVVHREVIGNAGFFCNVEDIDEYAHTISQALTTDLARLPLLQARKFDWDCITQQYMDEIVALHEKRN